MKCWIALLAVMVLFLCTNVRAESKLYVGNLSWDTTDDSLRQPFEAYGTVLNAIVLRDRDTGRSRGFGFVTMSTKEEAEKAIDGLNETELDGRGILVNLAKNRRK